VMNAARRALAGILMVIMIVVEVRR